jgi:replicative DNA helicase
MAEQFNFSNDFQDLILASIIRHPEKFLAYGPILEASQFSGVYATSVARCALDYNNTYGRFPAWETLGQLADDYIRRIEVDEEDGIRKSREYILRLRELDTADVDYVSNRVVEFARERTTVNAVRKAIELIKEGKTDQSIVKLFEDALAVGQNLDDMGYILHADAERIIDKVSSKTYGLRTGYPLLDGVWRNGWGPGWLIVPLAPPKRYKTAFSLNIALNVIGPTIGEDVFYYSCEISQELAALRALMNITGKNQDYLYDNPLKFKEKAREAINQFVAGNLLFKGFPSKTTTIGQIKAHAKRAIQQFGLNPRLIIIDYAETVRPSETKNVTDPRQQSDIYTEARALGHELKATVLMPDRCNRETVSRAVPNMMSFQGSFEKAGIVDGAIGICATDSEFLQNALRFFIFINRHGKALQHFRGQVSPDVMQIRINEEIEYKPDDEEEIGRSSGGRRPRRRDKDEELPAELR